MKNCKEFVKEKMIKIKGRNVKVKIYPFRGNCKHVGRWIPKKDEIHIDSCQGGVKGKQALKKELLSTLEHEFRHAAYCIEMQSLDGRKHKLAIRTLCAACKRLDSK